MDDVTLVFQEGQVRGYKHRLAPHVTFYWYGVGNVVAVSIRGSDRDAIMVGNQRTKVATEDDVKASVEQWVRKHPEHIK